ncbi:MAG: TA system VapC family ribonuclease toxin [Bryobacteraceae bacterium]
MILLDANLLIYAYDRTSAFQRPAREWLDTQIRNAPAIGLPWVSVLAFLRILSNPQLKSSVAPEAASAALDDWMKLPNVRVVHPGERHWDILRRVLRDGQVRGRVVTDAHLAALAIEYGATLCTNDVGFRRFEGVRLEFPLR